MNKPNFALYAFLAACLASVAVPAAGQQGRPDFTGLWTNYRAPGAPGGFGGGAAPSFKPEAQAKVAQYQRVTAGTNHSPGKYCVGTGMPGSMLGSGGVTVMEEGTDMVWAALRLMEFFYHESCGKCSPCREGSSWLVQTMRRIVAKRGRMEDLETLVDLCKNIEHETGRAQSGNRRAG